MSFPEGRPLLLALAGLVAGLAAFAAGGLAVHRLYAPLLAHSRAEVATLRDRLLAAWKDGYHVPDAIDLRAPEPERPMPGAVLAFLEQYDDAGRQAYETRARRLLATGLGPEAIVRHLGGQVDEAAA